MENGYNQCPSDPCTYSKRKDEKFVVLAVHVDDTLIASNDMRMLNQEKQLFSQRFDMHDMGEATFILGMKIRRDREKRKLWLSQEAYIRNVIERSGMQDCKSVSTPLEPGTKLEKHEGVGVRTKEYEALIGSLTYASVATRPDIAVALNVVSQFASNPEETHWKAAKRIVRYLQGTANHGIMYDANAKSPSRNLHLFGYVDADWAGDAVKRKSQSGYVLIQKTSSCRLIDNGSRIRFRLFSRLRSHMASPIVDRTWIRTTVYRII
jgi:hypothetical protein